MPDYTIFFFSLFLDLVEPQDIENGWKAKVSPPEHPISQYEFDVLIGADGKRNTLQGFKRKEFRGKLAIAITANFIHRCVLLYLLVTARSSGILKAKQKLGRTLIPIS